MQQFISEVMNATGQKKKNPFFKNITLPQILLRSLIRSPMLYHHMIGSPRLYHQQRLGASEGLQESCNPQMHPRTSKLCMQYVLQDYRREDTLTCLLRTQTTKLFIEHKPNLRKNRNKYLSEFFNFSTLDTNNSSCQTLMNEKSQFAIKVAAFVVLIL